MVKLVTLALLVALFIGCDQPGAIGQVKADGESVALTDNWFSPYGSFESGLGIWQARSYSIVPSFYDEDSALRVGPSHYGVGEFTRAIESPYVGEDCLLAFQLDGADILWAFTVYDADGGMLVAYMQDASEGLTQQVVSVPSTAASARFVFGTYGTASDIDALALTVMPPARIGPDPGYR